MNRLLVSMIALLAPTATAMSQSDDAVTITLDMMTRADRVAIQRGYSEADNRCFDAVLAELEELRTPADETYITFDNPDMPGIFIGFADTDNNYACEEGEMRTYEVGEYDVLQRFAD